MSHLIAAAKLCLHFLVRLCIANLELGRDLLRPHLPFRTAIFAYRADDLSAGELVLLSSLVSLTPGTLTLDLVGKELFVHSLYGEREDKLRDQIDDFARLIRELRRTR